MNEVVVNEVATGTGAATVVPADQPKKHRGRPKGAKNKSKPGKNGKAPMVFSFDGARSSLEAQLEALDKSVTQEENDYNVGIDNLQAQIEKLEAAKNELSEGYAKSRDEADYNRDRLVKAIEALSDEPTVQ